MLFSSAEGKHPDSHLGRHMRISFFVTQLCVERFKGLLKEAEEMPGGEGLQKMLKGNVDYAQAHLEGSHLHLSLFPPLLILIDCS